MSGPWSFRTHWRGKKQAKTLQFLPCEALYLSTRLKLILYSQEFFFSFFYYTNLITLEDVWSSLCFHSKPSFPRRWEEKLGREFCGVGLAKSSVGQGILGYLPRGRGCPLWLRSEGCCHLLWVSTAGSSHCQSPSQTACCFLIPLGSRKRHVFPHSYCFPPPRAGTGLWAASEPSGWNHFNSNYVVKNLW